MTAHDPPAEAAPAKAVDREAAELVRLHDQYAFTGAGKHYAEFTGYCHQHAADIARAYQAERELRKIVDIADTLVKLWRHGKVEGLPRAERNAAIEETREKLIQAIDSLGATP